MDLQKDFKSIQDKVDSLQKLADLQIQPPRKLEKYTDHTSKVYKWSRFDNMWGYF